MGPTPIHHAGPHVTSTVLLFRPTIATFSTDFYSLGYWLRSVAVTAVVMSGELFDSDGKDTPQKKDKTEFDSVMLMVQDFRNQIRQGNTEKCPGREGEGTTDNVAA